MKKAVMRKKEAIDIVCASIYKMRGFEVEGNSIDLSDSKHPEERQIFEMAYRIVRALEKEGEMK